MTWAPSLSGDIKLDLPELETPPAEPLPLVKAWIETAEQLGVREPRVATLATIGAAGPSTRTLLVKDVMAEGLVFSTSASSRKGRELVADPRCSVNFYWRETMQQIVVRGRAQPVDGKVSDAEFAGRPASARAIAQASQQSESLADEQALRAQVDDLVARGELQRPTDWHAWLLQPVEVELWHGSADRFHRRLAYRLDEAGIWQHERLQP